MNPRLAYLSVLTLLMIQLSTHSPVHGFTPDQSFLIFLEIGALVFLSSLQKRPGFLFLLLATILAWRFWFILVPLSWYFSDFLHICSTILLKSFSSTLGSAMTNFRFFGETIVPDPSKTGAFFFILFCFNYFGLTLIQAGLSEALKKSFGLVPRLIGLGVVRWVGFSFFLAWQKPDLVANGWQIFWGAGLFLSVFPLILFRDPTQYLEGEDGYSRCPILWVAMAFFLIIGHFYLGSLGNRLPIRVLIDESHSQWEPVLIPQEARNHPVLGENNYHSWANLIHQNASLTVILPENSRTDSAPFASIKPKEFSPANLSPDQADLLILKCPTRPFSTTEKEAVLNFVSEGGTLWAIGEHTDVFLINSCLNDLLASTGISIRSDGICDHKGRWLVTGGPLHSPLPNAPVQGLYMWATGASITGNSGIIPLAVSSPDAFSDPWVPTNVNFFGNLAPDNSHLYGPFILAGVWYYGKGKILVHGDSTNFNSSMLSTPGKAAFTRNVLGSLQIPGWMIMAKIIGELLFACLTCTTLGFVIRRGKTPFALGMLVALSFGVFSPICLDPSGTYPCFGAGKQAPVLMIDYSLEPSIGLSYGHQQQITMQDSFDKALQQLQQEHFTLSPQIQGCWNLVLGERGKTLLFAEPTLMPSIEEAKKLKKWVEAGGKVLFVSRFQLAGPARGMALSLGLRESDQNPALDRFPALLTTGCHTPAILGVPPLVKHALGNGTVLVMENWNEVNPETVDFVRFSQVLRDILK